MKSNIKTVLFGLAIVSALAITISSCNSKKENGAPVITIEEPEDGLTIPLTDSAHIEGVVTDDESLHELSIVVVKSTGDTVLEAYPNVHDLKTYSFHYHFHPSTVGNYTLHVTAEDHDSKSATSTRGIIVL